MEDTPVILLNGARQSGKSTLLQLMETDVETHSISLDDLMVLDTIQKNAQAYLSGVTTKRVIFDEVQRAPELFLPLKESVDKNRQPGRFILTGSSNVMMLPKLADTLAGRMQVIALWPLSQGELRSRKEKFIDLAFSNKPLPQVKEISLPDLVSLLMVGGYPEVVLRKNTRRRQAWFQAYINTILQRDVQELSKIEGLTTLPNLLTLIATRTGGLLNAADLSRSLGLSNPTLQRYLGLLEAVFLVVSVPPWFSNLGKRLVKSPRLYLNDTGLLCHLLDLDETGLIENRNQLGPVLENFVVMELIKQCGWSEKHVRISHYRSHTGHEVDIILEAGSRVVGIEVKSASHLTSEHSKGLRHLREVIGEKFHRGIVLYTGRQTAAIDDRIWAMPVSALWETGE